MTVATEIAVTAVAERLDSDISDLHFKVDRAAGVFEMYELSLHRHPQPGAPTFVVFYERDGTMSEIVKTSVADVRGEHGVPAAGSVRSSRECAPFPVPADQCLRLIYQQEIDMPMSGYGREPKEEAWPR